MTLHVSHRRRPTPSARGWLLTVTGALAVLLVLLVQRPGSPPLYDGVGFPDEPYRWVTPPAGEPATGKPTPAKGELRVEGDKTTAAMIASKEQGPQVSLFINLDTLKPPAGATTVTVEAAPADLPPPPEHGTPVSNLYRVTGTAAGSDGAVEITPAKSVLINLRANRAVKAWVILHHRVGDRWEQVPTFLVGTDVYAASLFAFGEYALFKLDSAADVKVDATKPRDVPAGYAIGTAPASGDASPGASTGPDDPAQAGGQPIKIDTDPGVSNNRLWLGLGLAALVLGAGLLLARRAARRQAVADGQDGEDGQDGQDGEDGQDDADQPDGADSADGADQPDGESRDTP